MNADVAQKKDVQRVTLRLKDLVILKKAGNVVSTLGTGEGARGTESTELLGKWPG